MTSASSCSTPRRQTWCAAGSGYLKALVRARRAAGLPGRAIAWGGIAGAGHVARHGLETTITALGLGIAGPETLFPVAESLLAGRVDVAGAGRFDWARARRLLAALGASRFAPLTAGHALETDDTREDLLRSLPTLTADEAIRTITDVLSRLPAGVPRTDPAEPAADRPLTEFGLDSLTGAELLVRTREYFDVRVSPAELMSGTGTLARIASLIHRRLTTPDAAPDAAPEAGDSPGRSAPLPS
ncbi:beta-ketoacyl reductase [Streptomyces sp. URMC 126]|uniref:acyl carrier protein n=1 Tax=Streptomyces sp. URMC 126 TaxID=3423401 RepID=UPI003F1D6833